MKQNWEYIKLSDICDVINGLWTGKKEPFINVAVIRNTNFSKDCRLKLDDVAYIDVEAKQFAKRKLLSGDIIIEKSGGTEKQPVGRAVLFNISEGEYSFSNFTATLRIKDDTSVNPQFLQKCLFAYYKNGKTLNMQSKTTGLHNLDMSAYLRLPIPIPSILEQEHIVAELDLLQGIIDKQKAQLKEYDILAQSIFYDMFGDPVENEKGWETNALSVVAPQEQYRGDVPSVNGKFWLLNLDMVEQQTGRILEKVMFEKSEIGGSTIVFDDTNVLYSKLRPYLNKVAVPNEIGYASSELVPLKPNANILEKIFLVNLLRSKPFVDYISVKVAGAKMPRVSMDVLREFPIILPPLSLQQQFAEKIEAIEKQKAAINKSLAETQKLFDYTMDKYFG